MKVIGYTRVSSTMQTEGDGPERQTLAIRTFCETHNLQLDETRHEAITGTKEGLDRPVFSGLLAQRPAAIVVEKMDRLARDLMVSELLLRECRKHGVKVFAADQGALINMAEDGAGSDPTRVLIRQVLGAVAQFEKSALVARLTAAKNRVRARTGKPCGGVPAYGAYEGEARVKQMVKDFVKAGHSYPTIARLLNEAGLRTRLKKEWSTMTVYGILKNK